MENFQVFEVFLRYASILIFFIIIVFIAFIFAKYMLLVEFGAIDVASNNN